MIILRKFSDPWYSADNKLTFQPETIADVEDTFRRLFLFRKYPATRIRLKNGRHYWAAGHHAAEVKAAMRNSG